MIGLDVAQSRAWLYSLADLSSIRSILDVGCGDGYDIRQLGERAAPDARLIGVDHSATAHESARGWTEGDGRLVYVEADVSAGLPFPDNSFDLVYSNNLLECLPDKAAHLREIHRVLRSGGQVVCAHWDMDSQTIDGQDKALVRKIVHAYADWQQAWMAACDGWMGRRLWRTFQGSGLFAGESHSRVLTNTRFEEPYYGWRMIQDFSALARKGMVTREEYDAFLADITRQAGRGEYFYSITLYVYAGRKV
jgi:SAM-dependent methyltransferase